MTATETIPAEAGKPCDCCRREHRKLVVVDGYWMGKTCAEMYQTYKSQAFYRQMAAQGVECYAANLRNYWHGREKQLAHIQLLAGN